MQELIKYAAGNPGAMNFLIELFDLPLEQGLHILDTIKKATTLRGTNLFVLYSDLCDKDMDKVAHLCQHCPQAVLEDACSRQDWSGRELVTPYLKIAVS